MQPLYLGKLSRPRYQQKLNKIMKTSQEDVILIKKYVSVKAVWCTKAVEWIARQGSETWKHRQFAECCDRSNKTGTIVPQPGSSRQRSARSRGGPCVQSGGQAKKASVSSLDFAWNCHSLFKCTQKIIHLDLQLTCFKRSRMLSCCLKPIVSPVSLADKKPYRLQ